VLLHADDVYKMRKEAVIETAEEVRERKEREAAAAKARARVAEERKEKMRSMEAARIAALPKSLLEQEEEDEKAARRLLAKTMRDESQDDIKKMNSLLNYAVTASIRDRQVAEKKQREAEAKYEERMRELQADIEALEQRKLVEQAEMAKKATIDKVKREMMEQLEYALGKKQREREAVKKEEIERKAALQKQLEQEAKEKEKLLAKRAEVLATTIRENERAVEEKKKRKELELALDRKADEEAAELVRQKMLQEAEKERQRKLREEAEFKVRGAVAKFYDDTERRQEMLMRRAFEEGARRERQKELERARKQAEAVEDLRHTRERMMEEKQQRMAELLQDEKAEFEAAQKAKSEWLAIERERDRQKAASNLGFLREVRAQVEEKEVRVKEQRQQEREELEREREANKAEMEYLRGLRDAKLREMVELGLPSKYTTQLLRYDPEVAAFKKELADRPPPAKKGPSAPGGK
jgi:hypothetical protein